MKATSAVPVPELTPPPQPTDTVWPGPRLTRAAFLAGCLNLCLYPVLMTLAGNAILLGLAQVRETLVAFGDPAGDAPGSPFTWSYALFVAAMAYWAFASWYCARLMLGKRFPCDRLLPCVDDRFARVTGRWLPRILGLLCAVPITLFFIAAAPVEYWFALAATAVAFLAFVVFRRRLPSAYVGWSRRADDPYYRFDNLTRGAFVTVFAMFALSFGVALATMAGRETLARAIGSPALVLIALGSWTLFGSFVMTYVPRSRGWPSLALLPFAAAFVLSFFNENHFVARAGMAGAAGERPVFPADLEAWHAARGAARKDDPIYLVAAAGGASRAAYWTGVVLTNLENEARRRQRHFAGNVYAVSGVSGGSLGLAAYVAALAAERDAGGDRTGALAPRPTEFVARDFLAPAIAQMLYADTMARFLPVPCTACDRSRGLEEAWVRDWKKHNTHQRDWFAQPLRAAGHEPSPVPRMIFNTTTVGDGRLVVQSDLAYLPTDAYDIFDPTLDTARLTRAGAIHNSARFTYVSPAAAIPFARMATAGGKEGAGGSGGSGDGKGKTWDYVVDGGYFENSGVAVLNAMIGHLKDGTDAQKQLAGKIVLIVIENDPAGSAQWICDPRPAPGRHRTPPAMELSAPPYALYQTRTARAHAQEAEAIRLLGGCKAHRVIELRYPEAGPTQNGGGAAGLVNDDPPMSWFLNANSRARMATVLCAAGDSEPHNRLRRQWQRALDSIAASTPAPSPPRPGGFTPADTSLACPPR